jgi:hypothetical protein
MRAFGYLGHYETWKPGEAERKRPDPGAEIIWYMGNAMIWQDSMPSQGHVPRLPAPFSSSIVTRFVGGVRVLVSRAEKNPWNLIRFIPA